MKFCYECGSPLAMQVLAPDDRERAVCSSCGYVHYQSPNILVGAFLFHKNTALWVKRGTEPHKGLWTFPGGFLETGETVQEAAARELYEETRIVRDPNDMVPFGILSLVTMGQVYLTFRCRCETAIPAEITAETADWGWFSEEDAPWSELAHPETADQAHLTYRLLREGNFPIRVNSITKEGMMSTHIYTSDD